MAARSSNPSFSRFCQDETQTRALARRLAEVLELPRVILLRGDLGAGKTAFVKGLVEGLGGMAEAVHSPTFSLVNHYRTPRAEVRHIDLYRLDDARSQYSIGLEELLEFDGMVVIEWSEKLLLEVAEPLRVRIEIDPDEGRHISVIGLSEKDATALEKVPPG